MVYHYLLSIVIPTYRNLTGVKRLLDSIFSQTCDFSGIEVLLINNSIDGQQEIDQICGFYQQQGRRVLSYLEPVLGVSFARNRGIKMAQGEWLVFIDDDEELGENYLQYLMKIIKTGDKNMLLGGPYLPVFDGAGLPWLKEKYFSFDYGKKVISIKPPQVLLGGNLVVSCQFLKKVGAFSSSYGYLGTDRSLPGEDTEFIFRSFEIEGNLTYHPDLYILHHISPDRYQLKALYSRCRWDANTKGLLYLLTHHIDPSNWDSRVRFYHLRDAIRTLLKLSRLYMKLPFRDHREFPYPENYIVEVIFPIYAHFWFEIALSRLSQ